MEAGQHRHDGDEKHGLPVAIMDRNLSQLVDGPGDHQHPDEIVDDVTFPSCAVDLLGECEVEETNQRAPENESQRGDGLCDVMMRNAHVSFGEASR